jgi:hypothetical protein
MELDMFCQKQEKEFQALWKHANEDDQKALLATLTKDPQGVITKVAEMEFKSILNEPPVSETIFKADQVAEITKHVSDSNHIIYDAMIDYFNASKNNSNINASSLAPNTVGPLVNQPIAPYLSQNNALVFVPSYNMPYNSAPYSVNQPIPTTYLPATRTLMIGTNPMASNIYSYSRALKTKG